MNNLARLFSRVPRPVLFALAGLIQLGLIAAMVLDFRIPGSRGDLFFYYASSRFPLLRRRTVFLTGDTSVEVEQMVAHTGCTLRHKPFVNASLIGLLQSMVEMPAQVKG